VTQKPKMVHLTQVCQ